MNAIYRRLPVIFITIFWLSFSHKCSGQLFQQDSIGLIEILDNNCPNCPLLGIWDTTHLAVNWGGVTTFWDAQTQFYRVKSLVLEDKGLDGEIVLDSFPYLESLFIGKNEVEEISLSLNHNRLKTLDMHCNNLRSLSFLEKLDSLMYLNMSNNPLNHSAVIPESPNLETLYCSGNIQGNCTGGGGINLVDISFSQSLPKLKFFSGFGIGSEDSLKTLDFSGFNELKVLYILGYVDTIKGLDSLSNLDTLDLGIPKTKYLSNLGSTPYYFKIGWNSHLNSIPATPDSSCPPILIINNTRIRSLPSYDYTTTLTLDVANNEIDSLPLRTSFASLNTLNCEGNNLSISSLLDFATNPPSTFSYSPQSPATLAPSEILALDTSTVILDATLFGGLGTTFQWTHYNTINHTYNVFPISLNSILTINSQSDPGIYGVVMENPLLPGLSISSTPSTVIFSEPIVCDPNRDGKRNMKDLVSIGLKFNQYGGSQSKRDTILSPFDTTHVPGLDWQTYYGNAGYIVLDDDTINLKHVDTNGDGFINMTDFGCILNYYEPLREGNLLQSNILEDTIQLLAIPQDHLISVESNGKIKIPYRVEITQLPLGYDSLFLRGCVFTRGIIEDSLIRVDSIFANLIQSDFANDTFNVIDSQYFLRELTIDSTSNPAQACLNQPLKQLDVGVIRTTNARWVFSGNAALVCEVLVDLRTAGNNGIPLKPIIPVVGDVNTVILYVQDQNNNIIPVTAKCASDTAIVLADSLFGKTSIRGKITTPSNIPVMNATLNLGIDSGILSHYTDSSGIYDVVVPYDDSVTVVVTKEKECSEIHAITFEDLDILWEGLQRPETLNEWQKVALDIDENHHLDHNDYVILRNYLNQSIDTFPGSGFWIFISTEDMPNPTTPFDYSTIRYFPSIRRSYGQDFIGVLKGDADFSWNPQCGSSKSPNDTNLDNKGYELDLVISPIPAQEQVRVSCHAPQGLHLKFEIFDMNGQVIQVHHMASDGNTTDWIWNRLDKANLPIQGGVYFAKLSAEGCKPVVKKFVLLP